MKIAALIARILLGFIFLFFGLNGFFNFLHGQLPGGTAGQFLGALTVSHYALVVSALQVIGGALLWIGRYIPLGLTILAPILVNILLFHITMAPSSILPGIVATILWCVLFARHRSAFAGILSANG